MKVLAPEALRLFRGLSAPQLPKRFKNAPVATAMRGNPRSKVLMIAPPMTEYEYKKGVPLSSPDALVFHELLEEEAKFSTHRDCLVMTCSRYGLKPSKHSCEDPLWLVQEFARRGLFNLYVCIGDDAFKHIFGRGKKPPMTSLEGQTMYVAELKRVPLFVFPNIQGLGFEAKEGRLTRPEFLARDWSEKLHNRFTKLVAKFAKEYEKL